MKPFLHAHFTICADLQAYFLTVNSMNLRSNDTQCFELEFFSTLLEYLCAYAGIFFCLYISFIFSKDISNNIFFGKRDAGT